MCFYKPYWCNCHQKKSLLGDSEAGLVVGVVEGVEGVELEFAVDEASEASGCLLSAFQPNIDTIEKYSHLFLVCQGWWSALVSLQA